jgi:hypothetical protein
VNTLRKVHDLRYDCASFQRESIMTASKGVGRGGKREGSGRKAADALTGVASATITLDQLSYDMVCCAAGSESLSVGVRALLHELHHLKQRAAGAAAVVVPTRRKPIRRVVPEFNADGIRYNFMTLLKMNKQADQEYEAAIAAWARGS